MIEFMFVFALLFMLFTFISEMGFLLYDWAVVNYQASTAAVNAATKGQFSNEIRLRLAQGIHDWSVNGKNCTYNVAGADPPGSPDGSTVYIYGTDQDTPVQRGQYISVNVDFPWRFRFFLINTLAQWVIDEKDLRLRVNAVFPSEVFIE